MTKIAINKGFTLIELVFGIVVLSIAMTLMTTMLVSQSKDSLAPLYNFRSSMLGESVIQSLLQRNYQDIDEFKVDSFTSVVGSQRINKILNLDQDLPYQYNNYAFKINLVPELKVVTNRRMKRIEVTIKTPSNEEITFSALKGDY